MTTQFLPGDKVRHPDWSSDKAVTILRTDGNSPSGYLEAYGTFPLRDLILVHREPQVGQVWYPRNASRRVKNVEVLSTTINNDRPIALIYHYESYDVVGQLTLVDFHDQFQTHPASLPIPLPLAPNEDDFDYLALTVAEWLFADKDRLKEAVMHAENKGCSNHKRGWEVYECMIYGLNPYLDSPDDPLDKQLLTVAFGMIAWGDIGKWLMSGRSSS